MTIPVRRPIRAQRLLTALALAMATSAILAG